MKFGNGLLMHYESKKGATDSEFAPSEINPSCSSLDENNPLYVMCDDCNKYMIYRMPRRISYSKFYDFRGLFQCPTCKNVLFEHDVITRILEENATMMQSMFS